ncbi:MAG: iron uptake porin, partial [Symploca sp. SIO2C1]|nr:iron uptake porin [Symploca sp. SIO2C1]
MGQVTSVSQLSDVEPTDWAFDALRSLVERYGCIEGFPDGTFRGNQSLSRYQFAAGLNACLEQIERLIDAGNVVTADDFETLQKLMQDFAVELASLETRIDNLDGRTAFLEDHQFSTTTKLFGQVIMGVQGRFDNTADFFPVDGIQDTPDPGTEVNLISN